MAILDLIRIKKESSLPVANQLCEQMGWLISTGEIKTGEQLPPIRTAAQALGVHMHTVRSAYHLLEKKELVTTRPGQGTIALPYQPFKLSHYEADLATHTIGVILPELTYFYSAFLDGVQETAQASHAMLMVLNAKKNPLAAEKYLDQLMTKNVDGVINASLGFSDEFQARLDQGQLKLPFPIVYADVPQLAHSTVQLDSAGVMFQAVTHLIQHGHEVIGLINEPQDWPIGEAMFSGFQEGLRAKGIPLDQVFIATVTDFHVQAGYQAGLKLVSSTLRPSAICAISDDLAIGAMRAFKDQGLRIPQDMAMVGYSDIEIASLVDPPLTTVSAPAYEMGVQAMGMLKEMIITKKDRMENVTLPTKLVIRRSCGCGG